jgi:S-formylglutathione hydrolase FrmB
VVVKRQLVVGALAVAALATGAAQTQAQTFKDGDGLHVTAVKQLDARLYALTVSSATLPGPANVRILLPAGYAQHPHTRYPVLYLFHGTSGGASDWTTMGSAEQSTAGLPLIVVMPDIALNDDGGGWCTNWFNDGKHGIPEWETFHIDELLPWVDANLRTIATRQGRAIAGLSQGGFCSMSYAARYPDLFGMALSYSGAPDIAYDAAAQTLVTPIINATETGLDGAPPNSMFGPRNTEEVNWAAHDPTTLAANLADTKLMMYTGNGDPGPLDTVPNPGAMAIEAGVHELTILFHNRLNALGIPSYLDDYGPGTHSWPYWTRDLQQSIGQVMAYFAHPPASPKNVTYTSADPSYTEFGWTVNVKRDVEEFSTLSRANLHGFSLSGSGTATVVTPAAFRRSWRYAIVVASPTGKRTLVERAGRGRRLTIPLTLGPSNTVQEYPNNGSSSSTKVYTTTVTVTHLKTPKKKKRGGHK